MPSLPYANVTCQSQVWCKGAILVVTTSSKGERLLVMLLIL